MYNLRPRRVINYNEDAYYESVMNDLKSKNLKTKNSKNSDVKVGMVEYINQLKYKLLLNDELKGQDKIVNVMKCMDMAVSLINNYSMSQKFADSVKTKIEEFLKEDIIKDMNRIKLEEYLQMF